MNLDVHSLLAWVMLGLILGFATSEFLTSRGYGQGRDVGISLGGAILGGLLVSALGLQGQASLVASTAGAAVGAILLTFLVRRLPRRTPA